MKRLRQYAQIAETGSEVPIRKCRQIEDGDYVLQTLENIRLVGDQQLHTAGALSCQSVGILLIRFHDIVARAPQNATDKPADKRVLHDHNYTRAGTWRHSLG